MLVKVLDERRVKILIEDQDVSVYNLPFEKLNYDDPYSKSFIYDLIRKTYEQTGIDFQDCCVMIEVIPGFARSYFILLTKMEEDGEKKVEFDKAERSEPEVYIYKMDRGGEVLRFFSSLNAYQPEISELYYYEGHYYVVLTFPPHVVAEKGFLLFLEQLNEFAHRCKYRYYNSGLLSEWGEVLATPNAYEILCR